MRFWRRAARCIGILAFGGPAGGPAVALADAEPASAAPRVALMDAVHEALAKNPSAVVAYDEIRRAAALLEQARSSALPTIAGDAVYTRLDRDRIAATRIPLPTGPITLPATVFAPKGQLGANLMVTVPLVATRAWAQWSHAEDQLDFARASASDVRRVLAVNVARAYLAVVAEKRVIDAATRARDTDRAHFDYAHQRFVGGVGNRIDEVRAGQQLLSDESLLEQDYASLSRDREALGVLVAVGGPLDADEPFLQARLNPARAVDDAEHRPDVAVALQRREAASHVVRDDWTDFMPYLTGVFEPFYWTPSTVTQPTTGWQAQLVLTVPLYDGGLRYGLHKERAALEEEAQANVDAVLRQARSDVRIAFEEVRRADAALVASQQASELARTALDLAATAYRAGATSNIEVIDAERTARDAETAVAVAEDGARQARLDLLAATGHFP